MNAAQRRKVNRKKFHKNEDIVYLIIRIFGEAVAVTRYVDGRHRVYISDILFKNKTLIPFHEWTINNISKAEYETLMEFGIPFVRTDVHRIITLGDLIPGDIIRTDRPDTSKISEYHWPM